jgi:hypothetical protein
MCHNLNKLRSLMHLISSLPEERGRMKKKGLLILLWCIFLVLIFVIPTLASEVIKLKLADQNAEMGWGWESLPKDIQEAITGVSGLQGSKFWGRNFYDTAEEGVLEAVKKGNYQMNRYIGPPEELAKWTKVAGEPLWKEWVKKMEGKGRPETQQVLHGALELLK